MQDSALIQEAKQKIASVRGRTLTAKDRAEEAIALASIMLEEARRTQTKAEKAKLAQLARLVQDPAGKAFIISISDQCFRSCQPARIAGQLTYILSQMGIPHFLDGDNRFAMRVFQLFGKWLPGIFIPLFKAFLRRETSNLILPGEADSLARHMRKRRQEAVRINLNHLGEAILGEAEAQKRLQIYLDDLANPLIECISVKISTIYSQINLLAPEETIGVLAERFSQLLRMAGQSLFHNGDGAAMQKIVNLDMEEYRDLRLTVEVFTRVLEKPEFMRQSAGIVLQSYLPDSYAIQKELTAWAVERVRKGGAPIKIRIVKGANLAMEQVEASLKNWPQAPYSNKADVDANFKRMLTYGLQKAHANAVFIGVASHNLFDIANAILLSAENEVEDCVVFEMLEGMADHVRRVVQKITGDMLLYCPTAVKAEFQYALAYLVRRLDENTAPENFLRNAFAMKPGSAEWEHQAALFTASALEDKSLAALPRREQNRFAPIEPPEPCACFDNEPDTDWALPHNQLWAKEIIKTWSLKEYTEVPISVGEELISTGTEKGHGYDPSKPASPLYLYSMAGPEHIDAALQIAKKAEGEWQATPPAERSRLLADIAQVLRKCRGDLVGAMLADTGKTVPEADVEVSEAIDFAEYYRRNVEEVHGLQDINWKAKGTVLVASPWNFPCSIPAGGILAALAAGNCVLFKPAPESVLVGWILVQALWEAGVSKKVLQFIPCQDEPAGSSLVKDLRINAILLTGATDTARLFLKMRSDADLMAETGGKNAIIVSAASDRDLAIRDIILSAFGHAGQKCSACSLAILEAEVYDDPHFRRQLKDAAASLAVGSSWDLATRVNPLIRIPGAALQRALTTLEEGEEWLLEPKADAKNPQLWSPGIKMGVKPGSFMHQTELFGPVLAVMRAESLEAAVHLANTTAYGLTSGLQTLDAREKSHWLEHIEAGNMYINRTITGAVVQRQPFGGCKDSSFGPGAKAGGPNYLMQLMIPVPHKLPTEREKLDECASKLQALAEKSLAPESFEIWQACLGSYVFFWKHYFVKDHDPTLIIGQDNFFGYRPHKGLCVRIQPDDSVLDLWKMAAVAATLKMPFEVSVDPSIQAPFEDLDSILPHVTWEIEAEEEWLTRAVNGEYRKVRLLSNPRNAILDAFAKAGLHIQRSSALANGRLELLKFLREVSLSSDYHRYGNLGLREGEKRKPLPQPADKNTLARCGASCSCH